MLPWGVGEVRGKIVLDFPATYQNLIDGAIQFIVSDGHGSTQTLVPIAYTPNNDLYISADQGGFEIINVHPGSDLYTVLELRGRWSGSGKSLMNIIVAAGPRVSGIENVISWPDHNMAVHENPTENVVVVTTKSSSIKHTDKNGTESVYNSVDGIITVPENVLSAAVDNRTELELTIEGEIGSSIFFLPVSESEDFDVDAYITRYGYPSTENPGHYVSTDFIDVFDVTDIVYSGSVPSTAAIAMGAYDENRQFIGALVEQGQFQGLHVVPDGSYRYIRACSVGSTRSLTLYFRQRGR